MANQAAPTRLSIKEYDGHTRGFTCMIEVAGYSRTFQLSQEEGENLILENLRRLSEIMESRSVRLVHKAKNP